MSAADSPGRRVAEQIAVGGRTISVDLFHPRQDENYDTVEVGLLDVRAADSIRISYDFDRDGWSIAQASRFQWEEGEPIDYDYQEVAFVPAWARKDAREEKQSDAE